MRVAINKCSKYEKEEVKASIKKIIENSDFPDVMNKVVLLKPNILSDAKPEAGITTHPVIVEAVIELVKERGAKRVLVGDSPGLHFDTFHGKNCGIYDIAENSGSEWINFADNPRAHMLDKSTTVIMARVLDEVDIVISLPKFKTHQLMYSTGAVKNMFGTLPGLNKSPCHVKYPSREAFAAFICKVYKECRVDYALMDGIIAMEGPGPANGTLRYVGLLLGSKDGFLVDRAQSEIMGYNYKDIPIINAGIKAGLTDNEPEYPMLNPDELVIKDYRRIDVKRKEGLFKALILPFFTRGRDRKKAQNRPHPIFIKERCVKCKRCIEICPAHALKLDLDHIELDVDKCIRCYCCHEMCPVDAIKVKSAKK